MIIRNSIKQLSRTPIQTIVMFLLITVSTALFVLGLILFWWNQKDIEEFENSFTTLGTVEQEADSVERLKRWENSENRYLYSTVKRYGEWIKDSVFDFEEADYLISPKKRPYFLSINQEFAKEIETQAASYTVFTIAEIVPIQTGTIDNIQVHVTKVLGGNAAILEHNVYISERSDRYPPTLEAGKTYIVYLAGESWKQNREQISIEEWYNEQNPLYMKKLDSSQYTTDGEPIGEAAGSFLFDEVTEGFYESQRGKAWMELSDIKQNRETGWDLVPVRPVESTDQLMPFHNKNASVVDGDNISTEEYATGADVCMISSQYAKLMGLKVGDKIALPLTYAVYGSAPSQNFPSGGGSIGVSELNAEFQPYQTFDDSDYRIVGIYEMKTQEHSALGLAPYEVIIPYQSVTGDWSNNIVDDGPMSIGTTVFQIPNGTIDKFQKEWKAQDIDGLKITFYDGGYSAFQNALEDRKMMSYILLFGGGIAIMVILALFGHLQIIRQRNRIFIERALGMNRQKCRMSILSGMYLIMICGVAVGGIASLIMTDSVMNQTKSTSLYKTTFSIGVSETVTFTSKMSMVQKSMSVEAGCMIVVVCAFVILNLYMNQILKVEPVELMEKEE